MLEAIYRTKCQNLAANRTRPLASDDNGNNVVNCFSDGSSTSIKLANLASKSASTSLGVSLESSDNEEEEKDDNHAAAAAAANDDDGSAIAQLRDLQLRRYNDNQSVATKLGTSGQLIVSCNINDADSSSSSSFGGKGKWVNLSELLVCRQVSQQSRILALERDLSSHHPRQQITVMDYLHRNQMKKWRRKRRWKLTGAIRDYDWNHSSGQLIFDGDRSKVKRCANQPNGSKNNNSLYHSVLVRFVLLVIIMNHLAIFKWIQAMATESSSSNISSRQQAAAAAGEDSIGDQHGSSGVLNDAMTSSNGVESFEFNSKPHTGRVKLAIIYSSNDPSISRLVVRGVGDGVVGNVVGDIELARMGGKQSQFVGENENENNSSNLSESNGAESGRHVAINHWPSLSGEGGSFHEAASPNRYQPTNKHHHRHNHYKQQTLVHQNEYKRQQEGEQSPKPSAGPKMLLLLSSSSTPPNSILLLPQQVNVGARPHPSASGVQAPDLSVGGPAIRAKVPHGAELAIARRRRGFSNFAAPEVATDEGGQQGPDSGGVASTDSSNKNNNIKNLYTNYDDESDNDNNNTNANSNNNAHKPINQGTGADETGLPPAEPSIMVATMMVGQDGAAGLEPQGPTEPGGKLDEPDQRRQFDEESQNQASHQQQQQSGADQAGGLSHMELYNGDGDDNGSLDQQAEDGSRQALDSYGGQVAGADFEDQQQQEQRKRQSSTAAATASNQSQMDDNCEPLEKVLGSRPTLYYGLIFAFFYLGIFVFGLFGNLLTLYVLICKGLRCTVQDILIGNLALSDVLLCSFAVPITPKYLISDGYWTLGPALCKIVSFAQSTSVYMSTYSLIFIGYIRYRLILHPLDESITIRMAILYAIGTWLVGLIVTLPFTLSVKLIPEGCTYRYCDETWEQNSRFFFSVFTVGFQFMLPLGIVYFFNKKIYSKLDDRSRHREQTSGSGAPSTSNGARAAPSSMVINTDEYSIRFDEPTSAGQKNQSKQVLSSTKQPEDGMVSELHGNGNHQLMGGNQHHRLHHRNHSFSSLIRSPSSTANNNSNNSNSNYPAANHQMDVIAIREQRKREKEKRMRQTNNRLMNVVKVFAFSWLPLNMFNLIQDYFEAVGNWHYHTHIFLVTHLFACSSVIWNPILYSWMSETYRQDFRRALPRFIVNRIPQLRDSHHNHHHHHHQGMSSTTGAGYVSGRHNNLMTATTSGGTAGLLYQSSSNYLNAINGGDSTPSKRITIGPAIPIGGGGGCINEMVDDTAEANIIGGATNEDNVSPTELRSTSASPPAIFGQSSDVVNEIMDDEQACGATPMRCHQELPTGSIMIRPQTCCGGAGLDSLDILVDDDGDVDASLDSEEDVDADNQRYADDGMV